MKVIQDNLRDIVRPNALPDVLNIGLTGRVGSGKSTVAKALQESGAAIVDFDAIARQITAPNGAAIEAIRTAFGDAMIDANGALNRPSMRNLVFNNPAAKQKLETITHHFISQNAIAQAQQLALQKPIALIYDIPLLYGNSFWLAQLDWIVVVDCDDEILINRVLQRNPDYDRHTVELILKIQATPAQLLEIANALIDNSKNETNHLQVYTQVNILLRCIRYLSTNKSTLIKSSDERSQV